MVILLGKIYMTKIHGMLLTGLNVTRSSQHLSFGVANRCKEGKTKQNSPLVISLVLK